MTSRGRYSTNEWEDYNSSTYDPQYPDDDVSGGVQLDHCRLYIRNIPKALNDDGLRAAFSKYGTLVEVFVSKDPVKRFAIARYETPGEAKLAMTKLHNTDPLKLIITIAHKNKNARDSIANGPRRSTRDDNASASSREQSFRRQEDLINGDEMDEIAVLPPVDDDMDPDTKMKGLQLELQRLQVQEERVLLRQQLLQLEAARKKNVSLTQTTSSNRCILPDGRIVVRNVNDRSLESRDADGSFAAGAGDSNERDTVCTCKSKLKRSWDQQGSSEGSSTPSTCVLCSEESRKDRHNQAKSVASKYTEVSKKSDYSSRFDKTTDLSRKSVASKTTDVKSEFSKTDTASKRSDVTSKKLDVAHKRGKSEMTCDIKYSDFYSDSEDEADETNRLIQLRNCDYMDIVGDALKVVIALAGYPKSKMRLRQMQLFQRCLTDVIDMQLKAGLLKRVPSFLDYYLNRGAIVCICKDVDTRDWMVRISPGLQERMCTNLILLKAKVKRLCLAVLKIPRTCWPATAQDAFKLLQYFNPTLKTDQWKIYSQKCVDNVECTSFLIDRVSGEIIRGPTFKNVIDYHQTEFELTGYTEIYYECLLSDLEDICSVASRVKLLEELRSEEATPRNNGDNTQKTDINEKKEAFIQDVEERYKNDDSDADTIADDNDIENVDPDVKNEFENTIRNEILNKLKDVKYISDKDEVIVWSDETNIYNSDHEAEKEKIEDEIIEDNNNNITATSAVAVSDKTESIIESNDNLISRSSNLNIDSNRGIAYHRRTNYLHVENELKVAITLEGYPQNKLEGTHIRRLKHLFKEYLHKDMKMQRFTNLIIPKFQDIYLSNGAVIYICDSLETKDYLTEVLPKFINSTGLKLTFRDIKNLVRYTRVVLRLPKEQAHVESVEILLKLQAKYPSLKPDCWKYYSDVAGKQKRQYGVDPESLDVIKSPDFDPTYEGEKLSFRIIDRQKRDVSFEDSNNREDTVDDNDEGKHLRDKVLKMMYAPIDPEITNTPLTRIRTNHYSDLIADDLKLYVGPSNYPETRIDEGLFHAIKRTFENIVCDAYEKGTFEDILHSVPKFHDMYLFDGVIFIICQNMYSREWMEQAISDVNAKLHISLKSTEFRGAVGIISMVVKTDKDTDDVVAILQKQNPRLRTKYWRKISTVRGKTKLDVVLQIDKLSAQVITSNEFNKYIDGNPVQFKLGHLQSLLKPRSSLEELTKMHLKKITHSSEKVGSSKNKSKSKDKSIEELKSDIKKKYPDLKIDQWDVISQNENADIKVCNYEIDETSSRIIESKDYSYPEPIIIEPDSSKTYSGVPSPTTHLSHKKVVIKIPSRLLPDNKDDLNMVFDLLEDKNPGLNTELWKVYTDDTYPGNGRFTLVIDRQSAAIIQGRSFNPNIGGEKLKFFF